MILAYLIIPTDAKANMLDEIHLGKCDQFRNIYEINKIDRNFIYRGKDRSDAIITYDGFCLVSKKFLFFCQKQNYANLEFISLDQSSGLYWLKIHNVIKFDTVARQTKFLNYNEGCKGFKEVIGATPVYLKSKKELNDGFYRTDIFFGSDVGKSPLYLIGKETKVKIENAGLKGIYFEKVLDIYN